MLSQQPEERRYRSHRPPQRMKGGTRRLRRNQGKGRTQQQEGEWKAEEGTAVKREGTGKQGTQRVGRGRGESVGPPHSP